MMWDRKNLKSRAKKTLRNQYILGVAVCFILAFVAGEYGNSLWSIQYYDESREVEAVESNLLQSQGSAAIDDMAKEIAKKRQETSQPPLTPSFVKPSQKDKVAEPNSRGVFAKIFRNTNADGSLFLGIVHTILPLFDANAFSQFLFAALGIAFSVFWWFFVQNLLIVGEKRFFLERINYTEVPLRRMLLPIKAGKWLNTALAMAWRSLFQFLWNLTVVGGIVKHYAYMMVPYILAENPDVGPMEALRLSQKMMRGQKWKAFVLDLSFLGWSLLSGLTANLLNVFFLNPYRTSVKAQLYRELRFQCIQSGMEGSEYFNDTWLFEMPEDLRQGNVPGYGYPQKYFPIGVPRRKIWIQFDYTRSYSLSMLILLFFTFSGIGWLWEVCLHIVQDGTFVNRGVMYGPWLPIYGSGGVLILVLLRKVRKRPVLTFFLTVLICGIVEYGTSWYLEVTKGTKWWDYSGYFLNLNGRICAEGLLLFGLGGCAFIYLLAPLFAGLYEEIPLHRRKLICVLLLTAFMADFSYAQTHPNMGKGITDYDSRISDTPVWTYKEELQRHS